MKSQEVIFMAKKLNLTEAAEVAGISLGNMRREGVTSTPLDLNRTLAVERRYANSADSSKFISDSRAPEWIVRIKREQDEQKAAAKRSPQQAALAAKTIQTHGPGFWAQLLQELQITVDSLPLIGIHAHLSDLRTNPELSCRIEISRKSNFPGHTYVNLFYAPGGSVIRCQPLDAPAFILEFAVHIGQLMLYDGSFHLSAQEAAKHLTEFMIDKLNRF